MRTINKMMTNAEIYQTALVLLNSFRDMGDVYMPAAVSYSLQKNSTTLVQLGEEIEKSRIDILEHYKTEQSEGDNITIAPENIDKANKELNDLLQMQQEVKLYCFGIEDIADIKFTGAQMQALMVMIDEDAE